MPTKVESKIGHIPVTLYIYGKVKVKLSLGLINLAPCHEDVWGSSTILELNNRWSWIHAPTALPPGKETPVPIA
jgi:hypothetical protein